MMKKFFIFLLLLHICIFPIYVFAEEDVCMNDKECIVDDSGTNRLIEGAVSGLLMEESTGKIIFEKDKDKQVAIASMTKMVAQIIILENIGEDLYAYM